MQSDIIVQALPGMAMVEGDTLHFEMGVGKGALVVSGMNQPNLRGRWKALKYDKAEPLTINPAQFEITVEPFGTTALVLNR